MFGCNKCRSNDELGAKNKSHRPDRVNFSIPQKSSCRVSQQQGLIAYTNAQQNLWHITQILATSRVVCATLHARGVPSCKATIGIHHVMRPLQVKAYGESVMS